MDQYFVVGLSHRENDGVWGLKPGAAEVTATWFGLARATARYDENFGWSLKD
jgi:hypothetical protein